MTLSTKATVCSRFVKTPNEKRIKSGCANNSAIRSTSSLWNGRKSKRDVSRIAIAMNKDESSVSCDSLRKDAKENRGMCATGHAARFVEPVDRERCGGA